MSYFYCLPVLLVIFLPLPSIAFLKMLGNDLLFSLITRRKLHSTWRDFYVSKPTRTTSVVLRIYGYIYILVSALHALFPRVILLYPGGVLCRMIFY